MFRKDDTAVAEWSMGHVAMCAERQYGILAKAAEMLKPGGLLVYSTCTFAPDENEGVISRFLREYKDFTVEQVPHSDTFLPGRPDWIRNPEKGLEHTMRLMPYKLRGEGHYIAALRRYGGMQDTYMEAAAEKQETSGNGNDINLVGKKHRSAKKHSEQNKNQDISAGTVQKFLTEELGMPGDWLDRQCGRIQMFGEQIYLVPEAMISMDGMKVVRPGLHLGSNRKNRIEPAHALALALSMEETDKKMSLSGEETKRYIHGESLTCGTQRGWTVLTYEGYPLGFGKAANGQMKNHYPRGLRK